MEFPKYCLPTLVQNTSLLKEINYRHVQFDDVFDDVYDVSLWDPYLRVSDASPSPRSTPLRLDLRREMVGGWSEDGREIVGRWSGDGREMVGVWSGDGPLFPSDAADLTQRSNLVVYRVIKHRQ